MCWVSRHRKFSHAIRTWQLVDNLTFNFTKKKTRNFNEGKTNHDDIFIIGAAKHGMNQMLDNGNRLDKKNIGISHVNSTTSL